MDDTCLSLSPSWLKSPLPLSLTFTSIDPQAPIHKDLFQLTQKLWSPPQALRLIPVDFQAQTHSHKEATMLLSVSVGESLCGCIWFLVNFVVCPCVGLFDFWLILLCLCCGGGAMVGLCVVGDARLHWLVTKIIGWRERVRERERMWGEKKYIKIIYRKL